MVESFDDCHFLLLNGANVIQRAQCPFFSPLVSDDPVEIGNVFCDSDYSIVFQGRGKTGK
jgi:hypothetical protein